MSKRLKLQFGGEAEMEERSFNNPFPDYRPPPDTAEQAEGEEEEEEEEAASSEQGELDLPFDRDGKVRLSAVAGCLRVLFTYCVCLLGTTIATCSQPPEGPVAVLLVTPPTMI